MTLVATDLLFVMLPLHPIIDRPMVAATVEHACAGIALRESASAASIAAAMRRLRDEPEYRSAAARLGVRIRAADAASRAADRFATARQLA